MPYFWLFPAALLVRSAYLVLASWLSRHSQFGVQARARVGQSLAERALTLGAGFGGVASGPMMVASRMASIAMETAILLRSFLPRYRRVRGEATPRRLRDVAAAYREFPCYSSWSLLLANGSSQVPVLLLPVLFGVDVTGLYALANRLLQIPMQLLGESIRSVYYKEIADQVASGEDARASFTELRRNIVFAGVFPFMVLLLFGEAVFATLFGPGWERAGTFSGIIGFYLFFQFIAAPLSCVFNAYRRQTPLVVISALLFVNNAGSLAFGALLRSAEIGLAIMSGGGIFVYVLMNYLAERVLGVAHREQFVTYGKALALNVPFLVAFAGVMRLSPRPIVLVVASTVLGMCYYALLYRGQRARIAAWARGLSRCLAPRWIGRS